MLHQGLALVASIHHREGLIDPTQVGPDAPFKRRKGCVAS